MAAPLTWLALGLTLAGVGLLVAGAWSLRRRHAEARYGQLISVDLGPGSGTSLRSERFRLSGRPDELRQARDGRWIPVEWKSRASFAQGPPRSHRAQVWAYCLLVEESTGRAPPFGVVRYSDRREFQVPWDAAARAGLVRLLDEMRRPYDGRAAPSAGKCAGCRWRPGCDARFRV